MSLSEKTIINYIRHFFNCSENSAKEIREKLLSSRFDNYYEIYQEIFPGKWGFDIIDIEEKKEMAKFIFYYCLVVWNKQAQYLTYDDLKPVVQCALYDYDICEKGFNLDKEALIKWYGDTRKEIEC